MVDDKKVKRIVEYFSRKREGGTKQLATLNERREAVAETATKETIKKLAKSSLQFNLSESAELSLYKKAEISGIPVATLIEIYKRGFSTYTEDSKFTAQQIGFSRVNSYVNKGKSYYEDDSDLRENFKDGRNPQDKGDMARHGLKGKSIQQLKKVRSSDSASPRKKQLAHWYINMHKDK